MTNAIQCFELDDRVLTSDGYIGKVTVIIPAVGGWIYNVEFDYPTDGVTQSQYFADCLTLL